MGAKKQSHDESFSFRPFKNLKEIIDKTPTNISITQAAFGQGHQISDEEIFGNAMKDVREISEYRKMPFRRRKVAAIQKGASAGDEAIKILKGITKGFIPLNLPDTQEYVEWVNPDYQGGIVPKLHKGLFSVQGTLDLHGLAVDEAEAAVKKFIKDSLREGLRCVKIIHGRGLRSPNGPVIKKALVKWLSAHYRKNVVAFVTARQCDGGLGALYVLLSL